MVDIISKRVWNWTWETVNKTARGFWWQSYISVNSLEFCASILHSEQRLGLFLFHYHRVSSGEELSLKRNWGIFASQLAFQEATHESQCLTWAWGILQPAVLDFREGSSFSQVNSGNSTTQWLAFDISRTKNSASILITFVICVCLCLYTYVYINMHTHTLNSSDGMICPDLMNHTVPWPRHCALTAFSRLTYGRTSALYTF